VSERIAVIINPISGAGRRPDIARQRAELAASIIEHRHLDGEVFVTERSGHARELTRSALGRGATLCIAWGGDGTVNEVASALVDSPASLAVVPSGSGNGLAREVGIPFQPRAAFDVAFDGHDRLIDAGELEGRLFFNIAGLGLDARVAHQFAVGGLARRGFMKYIEIALREIFTFSPDDSTILIDGETIHVRALLVAFANARQYGNGAVIAPAARIDDGRLDVVIVEHRSPWAVMFHAPKLFSGKVAKVPRVRIMTATTVEVSCGQPVMYHVDGEPYVGGPIVHARIRPAALRIRVPNLAFC
jgi:diacylglycerol kinase (ATP)